MTITLPSQVTALRKAHRLTQRELADLLGTTESTVGRLERERATLDTRWASHLTLLQWTMAAHGPAPAWQLLAKMKGI